jgi:kumamolisin
MVFGGTSAVAPLWAGLIALINQHLGSPVGYLNPLLYTKVSSGAFHDVSKGSNGAYSARAGWDPCTGLGSPDGSRLMVALTTGAVAASP